MSEAVTTELPADLTGPAAARDFVTAHARTAPLAVVDDAALLVSELVTNAVRYGEPPIRLKLCVDDGRIGVAVHDDGPRLPVVPSGPPGPDRPNGRGLLIVDAVARRWGVERAERGKRVWFEVGG